MAAHWHASHWIGDAGSAPDPPDTPTLAVADDGDGTATATISGSTAGATNAVYTSPFSGEIGGGSWTLAGSRTGDGDVSLATGTGHFWAYVLSTVSGQTAASASVYFTVTDGTEAVHYRCLTAVQARIRALSLSGIENANVLVKKLPIEKWAFRDTGLGLPGVLVTPQRETMDPRAGTNIRDDVGYGVLVTVCQADNQDHTLEAGLSERILWREKVARAFRSQRLSGVSEVYTCRIEPGDPLIPAAWLQQVHASALLLRFLSREVRGI